MSLSSKELNYLIWRYLQEAGLELSAYALDKESGTHVMDETMAEHVARGSLVDLVQRGIQFLEIESKIKNKVRGNSLEGKPYTLLKAFTVEKELQNTESIQSSSNGRPVEENRNLDEIYSGPYEQVIEWSPVDETLIATGNAESFEMWNFTANSPLPDQKFLIPKESLEREKNTVALQWNHSGNFAAQGVFEGKVKTWTADGKLRLVLALHTAPIMKLAWNPTDSLLLSVDLNNNVTIWDALTGDIRQAILSNAPVQSSSGDQIKKMSIGNEGVWIDSNTFAVTAEDSAINVYKVSDSTEPVLSFRGHSQGINDLVFDETSQLLCSVSDDHTIRIWHGKSPLPMHTMTGHTAPVIAAAWITKPQNLDQISRLKHLVSGSLILTCSVDSTIRLWDPLNGQCLLVIQNETKSPILCLSKSPNNRYIAAGGTDGILRIWNIEYLYSADSLESALQKFTVPFKTYTTDTDKKADNTISAISWNSTSTQLAVVYPGKTQILKI